MLIMYACSRKSSPSPQSEYPIAVDPSKVGKYPALAKSGGGYVYDDVLEYRVWIHPDGDDYYHAFLTYEEAKHFSDRTQGAEEPLVLVLQHEYINEPEPGKYEHIKEDRITEWRVEWLEGSKRCPDTITNLLREKKTMQENKEQQFWKWFEKNESNIFHFEDNMEAVFNDISKHLAEYKEGVVFEISQEVNGKRDFIISADGVKELFSPVESLKAVAPKFERWSIVAFRPRMNDYSKMKLEYEGKEFDPSEIWIYTRIEDGHFDLIVYHPEYSDEERNAFISGTYLLLDMALGEYDVVMGIRFIDHQKLPENPQEEGLKPFSELRNIFDEYKAKNGNLSPDSKPSGKASG